MSPSASRSSTLRLACVSFALFLLALAVRAIPAPITLHEEGVSFPALADEVYHMRRIVYSVERFPRVLEFDPYVSFPDGGRIVWAPAGERTFGSNSWARGDRATE